MTVYAKVWCGGHFISFIPLPFAHVLANPIPGPTGEDADMETGDEVWL